MIKSSCPKCGQKSLYVNLDNDLSCLTCGNSIALRREVNDTRSSKGRISKEKISRGNMDVVSSIPERRAWDRGSSNYRATMVRQGGVYRKH